MPASILMFGLPMARGMPWAISAVGAGIFGFAFAILGDIAITYTMDCYKEVGSTQPDFTMPISRTLTYTQVIGDAFAAVCFIRNAFATVIAMTLTNWINGVGLDAVFATSAALSFCFAATTLPMLIWGKKMRILVWRRGWFDKMSERQFGHRE
jgi:type IV secretory pathway TrbD component